MKDGRLVAAQIGCGAFANEQHLPNLAERGDVELRYCCDANIDAARAAAEKYGASRVLGGCIEALDDPELDFVMIATPHDMHLPIIMEASKRGKHIFCEKPMAMKMEECWEIIREVRRAGVKFCVDLNRRMSPAMQALRRSVRAHQKNERHNPWRYVETDRAPFPEERATNLLVRIQDESASYRMIHLDPLHGGGQVLGETVHWLDLASWFFDGQMPVEVLAWGSSRLSHGVNLKFSQGDTATMLFDACGTFDYPKEMFEVTSRSALFRSLFFVENRAYGIPDAIPETFPLQRDGFKDAVPEEGFEAYMKKSVLRHGADLKANWNALTVDKGHRAMLAGFIDAILNGTPSPCDEMAGMRSILLARLVMQSMKTRMAVPVPIEDWEPAFAI